MNKDISLSITSETKDIQLAVHFQLCGLEMIKIKKTKFDKWATFIFNDPEGKTDEIAKTFWDKSIKFPTAEVLSVMSKTKKRLYDE